MNVELALLASGEDTGWHASSDLEGMMPPYGMSAEMWRTQHPPYRCPMCRKMILTRVRFSKPDGTPYPLFTRYPRMDRQARATCPHCGQSWNVFASADTGEIAILGLVNTRRTAAPLGFDDHVRDNRSSGIPMSAPFKVSHRWVRKLEVQWEAAKTVSTASRFSSSGAGVERKVEQSLKASLWKSEESEQLAEDTVDAPVPPHRRLTVRVHWKEIWQEGDLRVQLPDGTVAEIPYRAAVGLVPDIENIEG